MSEFIMGQGLGHELEMAVARTGGATSDVQWLSTGSNFENVILLARDRAKLVLFEEVEPPTIDSVVRVDRSVWPVYPDFLDQEYISTPEFIALEKCGPNKFDVGKCRLWLHPKQKKGVVVGTIINDYLKAKGMLPSCAGFSDLLAIRAKGVKFFRQYFAGKVVYGWRSVVPYCDGDLCVPVLVEGGGGVVLDWSWLGGDCGAASPALRFAPSSNMKLATGQAS